MSYIYWLLTKNKRIQSNPVHERDPPPPAVIQIQSHADSSSRQIPTSMGPTIRPSTLAPTTTSATCSYPIGQRPSFAKTGASCPPTHSAPATWHPHLASDGGKATPVGSMGPTGYAGCQWGWWLPRGQGWTRAGPRGVLGRWSRCGPRAPLKGREAGCRPLWWRGRIQGPRIQPTVGSTGPTLTDKDKKRTVISPSETRQTVCVSNRNACCCRNGSISPFSPFCKNKLHKN